MVCNTDFCLQMCQKWYFFVLKVCILNKKSVFSNFFDAIFFFNTRYYRISWVIAYDNCFERMSMISSLTIYGSIRNIILSKQVNSLILFILLITICTSCSVFFQKLVCLFFRKKVVWNSLVCFLKYFGLYENWTH